LAVHQWKAVVLGNIQVKFVKRSTFAFTRNQLFKSVFSKHARKFASSLQTMVYVLWLCGVMHQAVAAHT